MVERECVENEGERGREKGGRDSVENERGGEAGERQREREGKNGG